MCFLFSSLSICAFTYLVFSIMISHFHFSFNIFFWFSKFSIRQLFFFNNASLAYVSLLACVISDVWKFSSPYSIWFISDNSDGYIRVYLENLLILHFILFLYFRFELSDYKSPQLYRILLSILANLNNFNFSLDLTFPQSVHQVL